MYFNNTRKIENTERLNNFVLNISNTSLPQVVNIKFLYVIIDDRPIILETLIMRYGLKGKARTRPDFFRPGLGPCTQFYPCEFSEQKWGQTPKP